MVFLMEIRLGLRCTVYTGLGQRIGALDVCLPIPYLIWLGLFPYEIKGHTTKMEKMQEDKLTTLMLNQYIVGLKTQDRACLDHGIKSI